MSEGNRLPPELVALVQHIELHQAGWWDIGLQRSVLAVLWLRGESASAGEIGADVSELLGIDVSPADVNRAKDDLLESGLVFDLDDRGLKLSEEAGELVSKDLDQATEIDDEAFDRFTDCLASHGIAVDEQKAWADFNSAILLPLIDSLGARTYDLITGDPGAFLDSSSQVDSGLRQIAPGQEAEFRALITDYLDPTDRVIRSYVLRRLNASFFLKAAGLPRSTIEALDAQRTTQTRMFVFLDTNFLFSILGLHDNPSNEAAIALLELMNAVSNSVNVLLRVLPITIQETRRVLSNHAESLQGIVLPHNFGTAARGHFSGLTARYIEAVASSSTRISAKDFFGTYESDLIAILRSRGVEVHSAPIDDYSMRQDVIDDLHDVEQHQVSNRPKGAKPYESNLHDMVLWHVARDLRPQVVDSPLEAKYWIATIDFGFIRFDEHKRLTGRRSIPICVHPAVLTQLLQFWVPRDDNFDEALMGAFRLPFLQATFDRSAEAMTLRMLARMSRYEGADDLPPDVIASVLENEALRSQVGQSTEPDVQDAVLEQALVDEITKLKAESDERARQLESVKAAEKLAREESQTLRRRAEEAEAKRLEADAAVAEREAELAKTRERLEAERLQADAKTEATLQDKQDIADRLNALELQRAEEERTRALRRALIRWSVHCAITAVVLVGALALGAQWLLGETSTPTWIVAAGAVTFGAVALLLASEALGRRITELEGRPVMRRVADMRGKLVAALFVILGGVLAAAIWSGLSNGG